MPGNVIVEPELFEPVFLRTPQRLLDVPSAWRGLEEIVCDLVSRYSVGFQSALEIGVEHGYSLVALSNYFLHVTGVDDFLGEDRSGADGGWRETYRNTSDKVHAATPNAKLVRIDYQAWLAQDHSHYDLVHYDGPHDHESTLLAVRWAARHATMIIAHDTEQPPVMDALKKVAVESGRKLMNYPKFHGLGILR